MTLNNTKQEKNDYRALKPQLSHIEATQQNEQILSQIISIKINKELKAKPQAQDFINDVKGIIIK